MARNAHVVTGENIVARAVGAVFSCRWRGKSELQGQALRRKNGQEKSAKIIYRRWKEKKTSMLRSLSERERARAHILIDFGSFCAAICVNQCDVFIFFVHFRCILWARACRWFSTPEYTDKSHANLLVKCFWAISYSTCALNIHSI